MTRLIFILFILLFSANTYSNTLLKSSNSKLMNGGSTLSGSVGLCDGLVASDLTSMNAQLDACYEGFVFSTGNTTSCGGGTYAYQAKDCNNLKCANYEPLCGTYVANALTIYAASNSYTCPTGEDSEIIRTYTGYPSSSICESGCEYDLSAYVYGDGQSDGYYYGNGSPCNVSDYSEDPITPTEPEPDPTPDCPAGSTWDGESCLLDTPDPTEPTECPTGTSPGADGNCSCPVGEYYDGSQCQSETENPPDPENPPESTNPDGEGQCPAGTVKVGDVCVLVIDSGDGGGGGGGDGTDPDGTGTDPDGTGTDPDGTGTDPDGTGTDPDGTGTDPDGTGTDPDGTGEEDQGGTGADLGDGLYTCDVETNELCNGTFETVWNKHKQALHETPFISGIQDTFNLGISGGGACPVWHISLNTGLYDFGTHDISPPCWIWDVIGLFMILTAIFTARSLIFGG